MPAAAQAVHLRIKPREACDGRAALTALRESYSTRGSCQTPASTPTSSHGRAGNVSRYAGSTSGPPGPDAAAEGGRMARFRYIAAVNAKSLELQ